MFMIFVDGYDSTQYIVHRTFLQLQIGMSGCLSLQEGAAPQPLSDGNTPNPTTGVQMSNV